MILGPGTSKGKKHAMKATVNPRYQRYAISVSGSTYTRLRKAVMETSMHKFVDGIIVSALDDPAICARVLARCTTRPPT